MRTAKSKLTNVLGALMHFMNWVNCQIHNAEEVEP